MARRWVLAVFFLASAACGASPASPLTTEPFQLSAGPHTLTISIAHTTRTNSIGITTSLLVCTGSGPGSASIPVHVAREGAVWIARPSSGSLLLRLSEVPGGVTGSMAGSAAAPSGVTVVVSNGTPESPAALPSTPFSGAGVGGAIDGFVSFVSAQGEQSCSTNAWSLVPRS